MTPAAPAEPFDVRAFLESAGAYRRILNLRRAARIFDQGEPATAVFYLQAGAVKLSVVSPSGKEAVVAILGPSDFFGEGCLAGQTARMSSATTVVATTVLCIEKPEMSRTLHEQPELADRFLEHMLMRNIRIEEDFIDQLFNSSEKRLARLLLLLARHGKEHGATREIPRLSQSTLAGIVGTTRPRVNFFLNKFRRLGLIEYDRTLKVNSSRLRVVLRE
jgi:CRP/FNR family transcriptional regulator, cyclic AMP receptor protein